MASLSRRVEELSRDVDTLRAGTTDTLAARVPMTAPAVEEEPANRVAVPPITPAKLNNRAFDVLLGTVGEKQPAQSSSV